MGLVLYDTASRAERPFEPLDSDHARMYVCGPTVYQEIHVGNARPLVVFDVLYRVLRRLYPRVTYVRNITDVDDKIIDAARRNGEPIDDLTARTAGAFHRSAEALGCLPPDVEPRATQHIPEMIALIGSLLQRGHAYEAEGHVLFHVPAMPGYGALSRRDRKEQVAGARVEVAPYKRDPADFVLWKPSTPDQPGWDSPWGRGRPGWHIECSAMSERYLGVPFDIHGGGQDLIFPHHENERAQTLCAYIGLDAMARYWVHNGYITVNGEKMSKSLGNVVTVGDALAMVQPETAAGETVRYWLLGAHYRQPLDFTENILKEAKRELDKFYSALNKLNNEEANNVEFDESKTAPHEVLNVLCDDLNTPRAIKELHQLTDELNNALIEANDRKTCAQLGKKLRRSGELLGLLQQEARAWRQGDVRTVSISGQTVSRHTIGAIGSETIDHLIEERVNARRARDFKKADQIRADLAARGIILEDRPDGTTDWRWAS